MAGPTRLPNLARDLATRIKKLPDVIHASYAGNSAQEQRVTALRRYSGEIAHDAMQIISWLERRGPVGLADAWKLRFVFIEDKAIACVIPEIPEYRDNFTRHSDDRASPGAKSVAEFLAFCWHAAHFLCDLAVDIERDAAPSPSGEWVPADHEKIGKYFVGLPPKRVLTALFRLATRFPEIRREATPADRERFGNRRLQWVYSPVAVYDHTEGVDRP